MPYSYVNRAYEWFSTATNSYDLKFDYDSMGFAEFSYGFVVLSAVNLRTTDLTLDNYRFEQPSKSILISAFNYPDFGVHCSHSDIKSLKKFASNCHLNWRINDNSLKTIFCSSKRSL